MTSMDSLSSRLSTLWVFFAPPSARYPASASVLSTMWLSAILQVTLLPMSCGGRICAAGTGQCNACQGRDQGLFGLLRPRYTFRTIVIDC